MSVEHLLFDVSNALRVPVLALALAALATVIAELGALAVELWRRRDRSLDRTEQILGSARTALASGDVATAAALIRGIALSPAMADVLRAIVLQLQEPQADERIAKRLADYEYRQMRRLERTRMLVRFGPALGLMGTLIPLSPALSGLAGGRVTELTDNLRVAFSVTVAGLLIGAIAFSISLMRDRLYGQDYSDVQYVAATLTADAAGISPASDLPLTPAQAP